MLVHHRILSSSSTKKSACSSPTASSRAPARSAARLDQYGDSCEKCSSVYSPTDLIDPYGAISGSVPVLKTSTHYFFRLSDPRAQAFLKEWTMGNGADGKPRVQAEVLAKDNEWLDGNLADWDISRDAPYFGIGIPECSRQVLLRSA